MSNVIDLNSFRKSKTPPPQPPKDVSDLTSRASSFDVKLTQGSKNKVDPPFHREATRTRFVGMNPPGRFVVMNTALLPPAFPPDSPPPLVA